MRPRAATPLSGRLAAAVLVCSLGAMLALNWPGQLSYDSVRQLAEGRAFAFHSWHPPVMALLLGLFDRVLAGSGLFLLFTMLLALFSVLAFLRPARATPFSLVVALLVAVSPQLLLYQGLVWKDVLFADAALASFAALLLWSGRGAPVWIVPAGLLAVLAAMTRQNGLIVLPFAALAYGLLAARGLSRPRALLHALAFLTATLALTLGGNFLLLAHGDRGVDASDEIRGAQAYDLAGMLAHDPAMALPRLKAQAPALETLLRTRGRALYTPERIDPFQDDPAIHAALEKTPAPLIFAQWRQAVFAHPFVYLGTRAPDFWQVLATPDREACRPLFIGVDGDPAVMQQLGLSQRWGPREQFLNHYGLRLEGTIFFSHLLFAGMAVILLAWLAWRRGGPGDITVACLLASALAFAASFFAVSVACDYRYLYFLDMAALAGALYACARRNA